MGLSRFAVDNDCTCASTKHKLCACLLHCTARLHSPVNTARKREGIRQWNWSFQTLAGTCGRGSRWWRGRQYMACTVLYPPVGWWVVERGGRTTTFPRTGAVCCLQWVCTLFVQCAVAGYAQLRTGTARCSQRCKGHVRDMAAPASRTSHSVMAGGCALGSLPRSNRGGSWRTDDEIKPGPVAPEAKDPSRDLRLCPTRATVFLCCSSLSLIVSSCLFPSLGGQSLTAAQA
ncbi:hypothetical protein EDB80DRAFT_451601 [Ilyonectria destructans]|nr:hypothetical protein EDB80DRAFT_451601 [Ilyonectria destructans]